MGGTGTGCQSFIIFITDGQDTDGDKVRCEKGYYTRSGYVPGKKCQYDWDIVWDSVFLLNKRGVSSYKYEKCKVPDAMSDLPTPKNPQS